jgi:bisphosphoglycerate-independent phosphoglycerate mutase (AlkP superfamily)
MGKKLSIIILNGWGLSSGWGGNAIAAANPGNFLKFWERGSCKIIKPNSKRTSLYEGEDGIALAEIAAGREIKSIKEIVDEIVGRRELRECLELKKSIENCKTNTSSLNLLATITENDEYSEPDHIESLLEILKIERVRNVNIHLILGGETGAVSMKVEKLANSLNDFEEIQIASIQGNKNLHEIGSKNFQRAYSSMVSGIGEKALDAISVLSKNKNLQELDDLAPHIICSGNQAIGKIFDFDSIISLDFRRSKLTNLIDYLSAFDVGSKSYKPMGIRISALTDYYFGAGPKDIGIIIDRDEVNNSLLSLVKDAGLKHTEIFGSGNSWKEYYLRGFTKKNRSNCVVVADEGSDKINRAGKWIEIYHDKTGNNIDMVTSYLSVSDFSRCAGSIKEDIESIKAIDKLLGEMVGINFNKKYQTIIFADESGLESNGFGSNPLPFIYIGDSESLEGEKASTQRKITIDTLLGAKSSIFDIAPSIYDVLGIEKPREIAGESLI